MDPFKTSSIENKATSRFGRILVGDVRDYAIRALDKAIEHGLIRQDPEAAALMAKLGPEAKELLKCVVPVCVDTALHYLMFMFEHTKRNGMRIAVVVEDGEEVPDLNAVSDGLAGDLVAWIAAFSKERHKPFPDSYAV